MNLKLSAQLRIAIVNELPLFRDGTAAALIGTSKHAVVGQGATTSDAKRIAASHKPDLMVLACEAGSDPIETIQAIVASSEHVKIVFVVKRGGEQQIREALRAGVRGCLYETANAQELIHCVKAVQSGELYVSPPLAFHMLGKSRVVQPAVVNGPTREPLSPKEEKILRQVSIGQSNKEIARELNMSDKTVKRHMTLILKKLRARNRLEAVLITFRDAPSTSPRQG